MSADIVERLRERELRLPRALMAEAATEITRLRAQCEALVGALEPFVEGYPHTSIFLRSREKMHPAGQYLYKNDVDAAQSALATYRAGQDEEPKP